MGLICKPIYLQFDSFLPTTYSGCVALKSRQSGVAGILLTVRKIAVQLRIARIP